MTASVDRDGLNLRLWFAVFCLYLTAIVATSLLAFNHFSDTGSEAAKTIWLVGLFAFYFSIACTFVPIPTTWLILLLASPMGGLAFGPLGRVLIVAGMGAIATGISHINEYHVLCYLLRLGKAHRVRETRIYRWAEDLFKVSPFLLQVAFNVVPVPIDPARWLAIAYRYPLGRFFLAHSLGRFIRYTLMAMAAEVLRLGFEQIIVVQCALVIIAFARIAATKILGRRAGHGKPSAETVTISEEQLPCEKP